MSTEYLITIKKKEPEQEFSECITCITSEPFVEEAREHIFKVCEESADHYIIDLHFLFQKSLSSIFPLSLFPEPVELPYNTYFYLFL